MSNSTVEVKLGCGRILRVDAVAPEILRLRLDVNGNFPESTLVRYRIIENALQQADAVCAEQADSVEIKTSAGTLRVDKHDGSFAISTASGKLLTETVKPAWCSPEDGFGAAFKILPEEKFYGLGDETREQINKRGHLAGIWVRNVACYAPATVLFSTGGWGVFVNSTWRHYFDIGATAPDILQFGGRRGEFDIFLLIGETLPVLLERYTWLSGRPALLPLWAYGLNYVCNQQVDARGMLEDCLNFRRENIPCDMVGLEPGWMSEYYDLSTEKKWHPERFYMAPWAPKRENFTGAVEHLGFKLSLWLCCDYDLSFEEERQAGKAVAPERGEAASMHPDDFEQDEHFGHVPLRMDKITKPEEPWFEHLKKFVDNGARAFKLDGAFQVNEHPDRCWGNGMTDEEMHNLYPVLLNKQMSQGYRNHTGQRPMIYTSGGYAGIQQYSATWAGDTGGGPKVLTSLINHGLSGHSNTSCDMSVFAADSIHFGFLQPWSQLNNWAYWRQPWFIPAELREIFKFYAQLRYRLLPYIYSMAYQAHASGMPVLRGLPLACPDDPAADNITNEYLFGDNFLVTAFNNHVHLPSGVWFDFWTGRRYDGPLDFEYELPPRRGGALFVKGGAVVPLAPVMDYVGQSPWEELTLLVYPEGDSVFELYEDDGGSLDYLHGKAAITRISSRQTASGRELAIEPRRGEYAGMPARRAYKVIFLKDGDVWNQDAGDSENKAVNVVEDAERLTPVTVRPV